MDSRFFRNDFAKYKLYPLRSHFLEMLDCLLYSADRLNRTRKKFNSIIASAFAVRNENVHFYASASDALYDLIRKMCVYYGKRFRVYIPDYSCPEMVNAVIHTGCSIILYAINNDLKIDYDCLARIAEDKYAVLILPALFGRVEYDHRITELIKQFPGYLVFDEAQSFPNINTSFYAEIDRWSAICSFGRSKPIKSIGGGALITKEMLKGVRFDEDIRSSEKALYYQELFELIKDRCQKMLCSIFKISPKVTYYQSLQALVYDLELSEVRSDKTISSLQLLHAYKRTVFYLNKYKKRRRINNADRPECFGDKPLCDYNFIPLKVDNEHRYSMMEWLATQKIQTTLYYYPVHLIPMYANLVDTSLLRNNRSVFWDMLIIPFGIEYSIRSLNKMLKTVQQFDNHSKDH